jgi:hypothetical protein
MIVGAGSPKNYGMVRGHQSGRRWAHLVDVHRYTEHEACSRSIDHEKVSKLPISVNERLESHVIDT